MTEEQEALISEYQLLYNNDEDNSDVENVLLCDEDLNSPQNSLSPIGGSKRSLCPQQHHFAFLSFLHYVSSAISTLSFDIDPSCYCIY